MANIALKDLQFPGLNNVYKIPEVDNTLTISGAAADAKKTGDELSDLKQDLNAIADHEVSRNLLDFTDMVEGYYINQNNGVATELAGQGATRYLPIEAGSLCFSSDFNYLNIGSIRYAIYNANKTFISGGYLGIGPTPDETTARYFVVLAVPENTAFIRISASIKNVWNAGTFQLEQGTTPTEYLPYGFDESIIKESALPEVVTNVIIPKKYKSNFASGNISDGEYLLVNEKASIKKAETLAFSCDITTFAGLHIGFTNANPTTQESAYAEITTTQVIIHAYDSNGAYNASFTHGLTIETNLQFRYTINETSIDFELISNGSRYANTANLYKGGTLVMAYALSVESELTNCWLSWCPSDINKKIWMFGDSYFGLTNSQRWMHWLVESGFSKNALIDAHAGRGTDHAITSLSTLIKFGKPDYIVWALGMNDGSDTSSAPSSNWVSGVNYLLSLCDTYNVIPIFCTIPNVPTINHTKKNEWIKESGYRYIDFAEAVGATAQGSGWYTGMLANDGVHPTEKGALALYGKAISNFPEVTITA